METVVEKLKIYFPFKEMYKEQEQYISKLVPLFLVNKNVLIQLPPAISKSACFFSVYFSWKLQYPNEKRRIIYAADTEYEIIHIASIAKMVYNYIRQKNPNFKILSLCVGEKKNLCIERSLLKQNPLRIEDGCLQKIAPWKKEKDCDFYENFLKFEPIPNSGCFSFEDLKHYGHEHKICPFYLSQSLKQISDVIICNFFYLNSISHNPIETEILKNSLLFVDECTGLDERITEFYTERISKYFLDKCVRSVEAINDHLKALHEVNSEKERLEHEYKKLLAGFTKKDLGLHLGKAQNESLDIEEPKIKFPGYIRKSEHFILHIKKLIIFIKSKYFTSKDKNQKIEDRAKFLENYRLETDVHPEAKLLTYFPDRLVVLLNALKIADRHDHKALADLFRFVALAQGDLGFFDLAFEFPKSQEKEDISSSKVLSLVCLSPRDHFNEMTKHFKNVMLNTELLGDLVTFQKILDFQCVQEEVKPPKKISVFPVLVSKGADLIELSNESVKKGDGGVLRNYSNLLVHLTEFVPDGILVLFPNETYIKDVGLKEYKEMLDHKLVFAETKDFQESLKNYVAYQKACQNGRGAVFLGLVNGKILETINFTADFTKCIMIVGMPLDAKPREYILRLKHLAQTTDSTEKDLVIYDSMNRVLRCLRGVMTKKKDFCSIIFADRRYLQEDKIKRLPPWIRQNAKEINPSNQVPGFVKRFMNNSYMLESEGEMVRKMRSMSVN